VKILALDTTTDYLSLGLSEGEKAYEYRLQAGKKMSLLLAQTIKRAVLALGWKIQEIDYFACGLGPGSFTGVRMGLSTIKGLAWPFKKPVVGISTLDILAKGVEAEGRTVFAAIDAKRSLIYCSAYKNSAGRQKRIMPYRLLTPDEFIGTLKPDSVVTGDAIALYKEQILRKARGVKIAEKEYWYPRSKPMIALAKEKIREKIYGSAFEALPVYLYPKECQIRKNK